MKERNSHIVPENRKAFPAGRLLSAISGKPSNGITGRKTSSPSGISRALRPLRILASLSAIIFCLILAAGCTGNPATPSTPVAVQQTPASATQADHASAGIQPTAASNGQAMPVPSGSPGGQPPGNINGQGSSSPGQPPVMNATMISEMATRLEAEGNDMSAVRAALASGDTDIALALMQQFMESHRNEFPGPQGDMTPGAPPQGGPATGQ
jgi:hypothetical protein